MILRFFQKKPIWEVDPQVPTRLLIQASHVNAARGVTFEKVAEKDDPDLLLWNVVIRPDIGSTRPFPEYSILVSRPSASIRLWAPHDNYRHWLLLVNEQVSIVLPDFEPEDFPR